MTRLGPEGIITDAEVNCNGLHPEEEDDETEERKAQWREQDQHNGNVDQTENCPLLQESPQSQPVYNGLVSPDTPESEEGSGALTRKVAEIKTKASETETTSFGGREEEELSPEEQKNQERSQVEVTEEAQGRSWKEQNRSRGEEEATEEVLENVQYGGEQESLKDGEWTIMMFRTLRCYAWWSTFVPKLKKM